jgi:catechol 2,3-dioxygenase-like lactoylglutathione lyase family enzyme
MPDIAPPTINHVALTVTDLDASVRWYQQDVRDLLLHRHDTNAGERFQETRTGLDHVGFVVPTRADQADQADYAAAYAARGYSER